jgi:hypothetical protein
MDVCREVVPPEVLFNDGVRVACHLYPTADAPMAGQAFAGELPGSIPRATPEAGPVVAASSAAR